MKYSLRQLMVFILLNCCFNGALFSQKVPMFETMVFFQDGIGNMDSILIGYDTAANTLYNPEYGELALTDPFNDEFEVRGVHGLTFDGNLGPFSSAKYPSKKVITFAEPVFGLPYACISGASVVFLTQIKHQPLKIWWDRSVFQNSRCAIKSSFLGVDMDVWMTYPQILLVKPNSRFACAAVQDTFTVYLGREYVREYEFPLLNIQPVEGIGMDTLYGVMFNFSTYPGHSPCTGFVSTEDVDSDSGEYEFLLYPNPASNVLRISSSNKKGLNYSIISIEGRHVSEGTLAPSDSEISVTGLANGIYFLVLKAEDGGISLNKFFICR